MDTDSLSAFLAVAELGSFSQAAQQLHLTQPAVSKRIATLENNLSARLFDRLGRKVVLTEAGRTLLPRAQQIVQQLSDCRRALRNLTGQVSGRLIIATSHHIGLHRLPPLLREFVERYPDVQLDLRFTDSELACDLISQGEVELGIVTLPPQPGQQLICQTVWDDPLNILVHCGHPLANIPSSIGVSAQQLARHPVILPGEITFTRRLVDGFFSQAGVSLNVTFSTNYLETIKMMVSVGLGWSVLPASMLDHSLAPVQLQGFDVHRTLGIVYHRNHTLSNSAQAMCNLLKQN